MEQLPFFVLPPPEGLLPTESEVREGAPVRKEGTLVRQRYRRQLEGTAFQLAVV